MTMKQILDIEETILTINKSCETFSDYSSAVTLSARATAIQSIHTLTLLMRDFIEKEEPE